MALTVVILKKLQTISSLPDDLGPKFICSIYRNGKQKFMLYMKIKCQLSTLVAVQSKGSVDP